MADCIHRFRQIPKVFWLILLFAEIGQVMLIVSLVSPHWSVIRSGSNSSDSAISEVTVGIWQICVCDTSGHESCASTRSLDSFAQYKSSLIIAVVIGFWPVLYAAVCVVKPGLGGGKIWQRLAVPCLTLVVVNLIGSAAYAAEFSLDDIAIPSLHNPVLKVSWAQILNFVGCAVFVVSGLASFAYDIYSSINSEGPV